MIILITQVIRYADVLLMLAEANIQTGSLSAALPLINTGKGKSRRFSIYYPGKSK